MKAVHVVLLLAALTGEAACLFTKKYTFVSATMNWQNAQASCRAHNMDLATINSEAELNAFNADAVNYLDVTSWIGLSRSLLEADFAWWSDGTQLTLDNWQPGYPKKTDSYLCVSVTQSAFANGNCAKSLPFFCQKWAPKLIVVNIMMNWEEALKHCIAHYSNLVSLSTEDDLLAVKTATQDNRSLSLWTGLRYMDRKWFWVNRRALWSFFSLSSCPVRPYQCGALRVKDNTLDNRNCEEDMFFMCYY